jgi:hypothetical protein
MLRRRDLGEISGSKHRHAATDWRTASDCVAAVRLSAELSCFYRLFRIRRVEPVPHQDEIGPRELVTDRQRLMADVGVGFSQHRSQPCRVGCGNDRIDLSRSDQHRHTREVRMGRPIRVAQVIGIFLPQDGITLSPRSIMVRSANERPPHRSMVAPDLVINVVSPTLGGLAVSQRRSGNDCCVAPNLIGKVRGRSLGLRCGQWRRSDWLVQKDP